MNKIVVGDNIRLLRKQRKLTQTELGKRTHCSRATIGAYEEGRAIPPVVNLWALSRFFGLSMDTLVFRPLAEEPLEGNEPLEGPVRVLTITASTSHQEAVHFVPAAFQARYPLQCQSPGFIEQLPAMALPGLPPASTYRGFEATDNGALHKVPEGHIGFGRCLHMHGHIQQGQYYAVVTRQNGLMLRRVFRHGATQLCLVPDGTQLGLQVVPHSEVLEMWSIDFIISTNLQAA